MLRSVLTMQRNGQARIATAAGLFLVLIGLFAGLFIGAAPASAQTMPEVVATIQGQPITAEELTEALRGELLKVDMQRYEILKNGLDELVGERLLELEAKTRGISADQLRQEEITAKVSPASEEEVKKFYEDNKGRIKQPFDQIKGRIKQYLDQRAGQERERDLMRELRQRYSVSIALEPPKVDVGIDDDPILGPEDAVVTIIEFSDFECPYCRRVQPTLKRIMKEYEGKVRLVFRDFPLSFHKNAQKAAEAAHCAGEQEKYWLYHDKLFEQTALAPADLKKYAGELELDMDAFNACFDSGKYAEEIAADMQDGQAAGVSATPSFFVNGQPLSGAVPYERFQDLVESALAQSQSAKQN